MLFMLHIISNLIHLLINPEEFYLNVKKVIGAGRYVECSSTCLPHEGDTVQ